jgi:hypothetical protein
MQMNSERNLNYRNNKKLKIKTKKEKWKWNKKNKIKMKIKKIMKINKTLLKNKIYYNYPKTKAKFAPILKKKPIFKIIIMIFLKKVS